MKIIIGTLVFLMSLALTGLVILFGINEMLGLHFRYWMFGFLIINFIVSYNFHLNNNNICIYIFFNSEIEYFHYFNL